MDDTKNITAQNNDATPLESVETSPVSEPKEEVKTSEDAKKQEGQPAEEKPTRGEKRFRDLSEKNRKLAEEVEALRSQVYGQVETDDQPLYDPNETEVDLNDLQARIDRRIEQKVAERLAKQADFDKEINGVKRLYNDFAEDLEGILEKHPEFDEGGDLEGRFTEVFNRLNTEVRNGKPVYVPKVKASEIVDMFSSVKSTLVDAETARITGATLKQAMESSMTPTSDKGSSRDYGVEELRNRASQTGDTETWAQYLKQKGYAKVTQ